jgi:hypothetical protein
MNYGPVVFQRQRNCLSGDRIPNSGGFIIRSGQNVFAWDTKGPGYYESCILKHRPYVACSEAEATERAEQARARGSDENGCG